ncbi:MAG: PilZ domain-containing protein [Gammaproteobacteria bacterium]|nr:MAG: PilZ domain-containing protein [Gammaproteobacteria bacterium]
MATLEAPMLERNLRHHLRIEAAFPATLMTEDGQACECEIVNLSRTGIMVACDRATLETLMPSKQRESLFAPLNPVTVDACFELTLSTTGRTQLNCGCHIIHTRRLARDVFHVGLEFVRLEPRDRLRIEQFIAERKPR